MIKYSGLFILEAVTISILRRIIQPIEYVVSRVSRLLKSASLEVLNFLGQELQGDDGMGCKLPNIQVYGIINQ